MSTLECGSNTDPLGRGTLAVGSVSQKYFGSWRPVGAIIFLLSLKVSERLSQPGVAIGLAWTPLGGEIMFVEASRMDGEGQLTLTGQLGDVMKESAHLAISWLRSNAKKYHLTNGEWPAAGGVAGRGGAWPRARAGPPVTVPGRRSRRALTDLPV